MAINLLFQGDAQVHLYGRNALVPISLNDRTLSSMIGTETSDLIVNDHRYKTIQLIRNSPANCYPGGFLKVFNRPTRVEIQYDPNKESLEIDLYDIENLTEKNLPILWMGVFENNLMPNYEVEWEVLKPIDKNNTAFCAIVEILPVFSSNQFSLLSTSDDEALFSK